MDGRDDVRPGPAHRASDPSLEDMLRRARDAQLGDPTDYDGLALPAYAPPRRAWRGSRLRDWLLVAAGVLVGVLLSVAVVNVTVTVRSWTAPVSPAAPTATTASSAAPTSTPTAVPTVTPTATPVPTATAVAITPPTTEAIVTLVQDYYDTQGPYTGSYLMLDVTGLQIQGQDETQLMVCISYEAATMAAPDTVAASNIRLFTLEATSDGAWQVVQMDASNSCSLN